MGVLVLNNENITYELDSYSATMQDSLELRFFSFYDFNTIYDIFSNKENIKKIIVKQDGFEEYVFLGYTSLSNNITISKVLKEDHQIEENLNLYTIVLTKPTYEDRIKELEEKINTIITTLERLQ